MISPVRHLQMMIPNDNPSYNSMIYRFSTGFAALGCVLLASCYPYNENPKHHKSDKVTQTPTPAEQQKIKDQRDLAKKQADLKKQELLQKTEQTVPNTSTTTTNTEVPKTSTETKRDYAFANKVPGKEGFVFSPYNNKVVDVRDIPTGTLVQDPTYPVAEKKYFRVP
jgi:hypothetical protein